MNRRVNIRAITFFSICAFLLLPSYVSAATQEQFQINPRGGRVLRIAGFDLRQPNADVGLKYEKGEDGMGCYLATGYFTSRNTLPVLPNRSYIISILLNCDFERPAEVNMGLQTITIDGGGKRMIWNINGIPNKTNGWQRWEWEFTADSRANHGRFVGFFYSLPKDSPVRIADIAFVELPPKELKPYEKGKGATFRGNPGNLPMQIENVAESGNKIDVRTTGALYSFDIDNNTIVARQMLERERDISVWRSSLSLKGLRIINHNRNECLLGNDNVTIGIQADSLVMMVPHEELVLTCTSRIGGKWNRFAEGHLFVRDEYGGMAVNPDTPSKRYL